MRVSICECLPLLFYESVYQNGCNSLIKSSIYHCYICSSSSSSYQLPYSPLVFTFNVSCTFIKISGSLICIANDYASDVSSVARMGVSHSSNPSHFVYDHVGSKVISLNNDSDSERLLGDSRDERSSSRNSSFNALLSNDDFEEGHTVVSMPPSS